MVDSENNSNWKTKDELYNEQIEKTSDKEILYQQAFAIVKGELIKAKKEKEITAWKIAKELIAENEFLTTDDTETVFVYDNGIYTSKGISFIKKWCQEECGSSLTTHKMNEIINHIRRTTYISREKLEKISREEPNLICCENGLLNVETKELIDFTSDKIIFNKIPVFYNSKNEYEEWEKFVLSIVGEKNLRTLQKFFGYCLRRDCIYEKALIFYGMPGSGKSRIIFVLARMLGEENITTISIQSFESDKFRLVRIDKKLANLCPDISKRDLSKTSEFKKSVSGDRMTGEKKGENSYDFYPYAKHVFSANELPIVFDLTDGFFDRLCLIKTENKFRGTENEVRDIQKKFTANDEAMSGILNWALEGYRMLMEDNGFPECKSIENRKAWIRESDSVQDFIDNCVNRDIEGEIGKAELFGFYEDYCRENGTVIRSYDGFCKMINKKLDVEDYNPSDGKGGQIHKWKGIRYLGYLG